ncbi:type III polyketide synthase [Legionella jordanis]|uniref:Naringenin-chalcone synthase n=1 Tax=Legionella jordanis TaxID=456 RepID=A0A0W0V8J9_9GAMM|nr:type III polyketide synthase [Legionella jordanis]KTD16475.1 Naringenin-chalcone synthase [Legionella jordanis]RMX03975.1 type III polyketide synthase [Legionella jordanis]RMX21955.1 type III polyketide synthase [Legionella jordanis]VEH12065.1 Naringenin-chalcone synthase [Legionella jordanis]HAT8712634.1 type III polyketide synthase [Legionella jordanis]
MQSAITAIGLATPPYKRSQHEIAELICNGFEMTSAERRLVKAIYKSCGIEQRHSVLSDYCKSSGEFEFFPNAFNEPLPSTAKRMRIYKEHALKLALSAIEQCLQQIKSFNKQDISHVITVSCTGMYAPGLDIEIVQELGLNSTSRRTAINFMGCYGAFNALKIADSICQSNENASVLIVCVEICTIHFQKNQETKNIISNAIFADGAAAALIQRKQGNNSLQLEAFHCDLMPQTKQEMAWHIADFGFDIDLSVYVPDVIRSGISVFVNNLLNKANSSFHDIDYYAIHPGGIKILQACEQALNITEKDNEHSYAVLREFGNMSSSTILFVLKRLWECLSNKDNQKTIFSCAFGPGLTLESMLLRVSYC